MSTIGQWSAEAPLAVSARPQAGLWEKLKRLFFSAARREYREAVRRLSSPEIAQASERELIRIGDVCHQADDPARAAAAYWSAGRLLMHRADLQKAVAVLKRVVAIAPMEPRARLELAQCFERLRRMREASQQYRAAGFLLKDAKPVEALELVSYALVLDPNDFDGRAQLAQMRSTLHVPAKLSFAPPPPPVVEAAEPFPIPVDVVTQEYAPLDLERLLKDARGPASG
jgi:tetratricopeptide (TPR) repeat protein